MLSCTDDLQAEAEEVAATREAQSAGDYKKASKAEEMLSKELVKANSEWTNRKTAYKSELKALEALKESEAEGGAAEVPITITVYIYTNYIYVYYLMLLLVVMF
jgi:hypothetical protein